jgi:hypothetical protein
VQFAAGVLKKEDKQIMPNYKCPIFQKIYDELNKD